MAERQSLQARSSQLASELSDVRARLAAIDDALRGIELLGSEILVPNDEESEEPITPENDPSGLKLFASQFGPTGPSQADQPIKRIRSTEMVAQLVRDHGVLSRDEIHSLFEATYGFPPTWRSPANALNNAINRAIDRGDVRRVGSDAFAPADDGLS